MLAMEHTLPGVKERAIWKLPKLLENEQVTPYRLHKVIADSRVATASRNTIYRWSNELPDTLDVALLMSVIYALKEITGKEFTVSDLIEYNGKESSRKKD